jgi:tetratricopeptide (TPR) repeat protein
MITNSCCAECGNDGGVSLKPCKACMLVSYCNAECQRKHWPTHKIACKQRAAELRDEALFKDPPAKEDCPICFLPMPVSLISCISLPLATITSVPIYDFAMANMELAKMGTDECHACCGKSSCGGCIIARAGKARKCPFCNDEGKNDTNEEIFEEMMKRVEANDAGAMCALGCYYSQGLNGLQQDRAKAMELFNKAAELGSSHAHYQVGVLFDQGGDLKKAKFHWEAAAMAGHEMARYNLGCMELHSGDKERAVKHWMIAASAGCYNAMHLLITCFKGGYVSRESIDSTLTAYNNSCVEMRSDARDKYISELNGGMGVRLGIFGRNAS